MPVSPIHPASQHYYGFARQQPMSYKSLQEALTLVKQAVAGEREDELFYEYLISVAPSQEEKEIIISIRNDERKHNQMFRKIYQDFTGQSIVVPANATFEKPVSYLDGIRKALFGELGAVERYRDIRAGLPTRYYRDMVFEILTDEQKHATKYNYILNLNVRSV
ncbi:ferritin-like domain-containing protein [Paenibacillus sp. T1]|uniref:Ferritin-like domain-containing protein n=2 Tax=Paenibacillus glycinis TaxID=2697035 RepID=A0ABW9XR36_9BACL|nr:ferritin-like domain-containing protein [Paenibacillus glycinis]